jgi:hypothetical protein
MNKFDRIFRSFMLGEANLFSTENIQYVIDQLAQDKRITDNRIIDWFVKAEKKYFQDSQNDNQNITRGLLRKHEVKEGDPSWAADSYEVEYTDERISFLNHVADYFNTKDEQYLKDLFKKTYKDVYLTEIPAWDKSLASAKVSNDFKLKEGVDYEVIKSVPPYKWVQSLSKAACKYEGDSMGHCAAGYDPENIISLWDENNKPHVTLEIQGDEIHQIKGKQNAAPVPKYVPYVVDFIKGSDYVVVSDGLNIGMVKWGDQFYFRDSQKYEDLKINVIIPTQKKRIDQILSMIKTVNEQYQYVSGYLRYLK